MKIKDIINEAFGTKRVKDPYDDSFVGDYEKDPETGEYTGREAPDPKSFTTMIKGIGDRLSSGSGSMWINAPNEQEPKQIQRYKVKPGYKLTVNTKDGREYFKLPAKPGTKDSSGYWTDASGKEIFADESVNALESLVNKNGRLSKLPDEETTDSNIVMPGDPSDEPVGEPSVSAPLHPDVSIVQSVPLVMQYKGKRFEMDDMGQFHPFGTTRPVTAALQTFLTKERAKL